MGSLPCERCVQGRRRQEGEERQVLGGVEVMGDGETQQCKRRVASGQEGREGKENTIGDLNKIQGMIEDAARPPTIGGSEPP